MLAEVQPLVDQLQRRRHFLGREIPGVLQDSEDAAAIGRVVRASVEYAWAHPDASGDYVAEHADEMSPQVQQQHIALYVNDFTRDLGEEGYAAISALLDRAHAAGLTPNSPALH
jgi:1,4-dihydroxy-6-naphthoate synthase